LLEGVKRDQHWDELEQFVGFRKIVTWCVTCAV